MNNRTILTGFAILVLGGLVALIVALGRGHDDAGGATNDKVAVAPQERGDGQTRAAGDPVRPNLDVDTPDAPGEAREPVVYMTDAGVLVRDHRSDPSKPAPLDNLPTPNNAPRKMNRDAIVAVRGALRNVVHECERRRTGTNTGDNPRIQAVVTVSVVAEKLEVEAVRITGADIDDVDAVGACVRDGFKGHSMAVPGQPDIAGFNQTHPFRLRR